MRFACYCAIVSFRSITAITNIRDVHRGLFHRGWFQNNMCCLKLHSKQHCCNTDTTCNDVYFETTPYENPNTSCVMVCAWSPCLANTYIYIYIYIYRFMYTYIYIYICGHVSKLDQDILHIGGGAPTRHRCSIPRFAPSPSPCPIPSDRV